ncbi:MAG: hypothetical protein QXP73_01765 [Candidatus Methanomethylicaceae archaeon]|nr:hypothetical protein [Candidatus Verstraetearchaeota archaeon]
MRTHEITLVVLTSLLLCIYVFPVRAESVQERFQNTISSWMQFFENNLEWFSLTLNEFLKRVIKITYFTIGLAGFVLWASGFSKYTGRRLMVGALIMAFVAEILL